jgi:hypothetical protein
MLLRYSVIGLIINVYHMLFNRTVVTKTTYYLTAAGLAVLKKISMK